MLLLPPPPWPDYQLIDTGGFEKIERFGKYFLVRPEPQAVWDKSLTEEQWEKQCHASFKKEKNNPEKGEWDLKPGMPEQWYVDYSSGPLNFRMRLGLTAFRHIGIFPEQSNNWDYIYHATRSLQTERPRVLNLFAYTGGASLAACAGGAEVVHLDSVKQVVTWARHNMEASHLDNIRWVAEDAMKFVKRESRRGNQYEGIILDPPAYGRGPEGEKWLLEEMINDLLKQCASLLKEGPSFLVINLYSMGFSALILESLVKSVFPKQVEMEFGEFFIPDSFGKKLPLGIFLRFKRS
ncbi:MAG: class I SAM-dependent methyltransferase [Bacteroidetes bacterium]|nr:class I SAM-dependent methyltransferase [Bacteroidota bacterium]